LDSALRLEELTVSWAREGTASAVDLAQVQIARLQAERAVLNAQTLTSGQADQLLVLIGHSPGESILPVGQGELRADPTAESLEGMMGSNLDLALMELQADAAERRLEDANGGRLPSLDLSAGAGVASLQDSPDEALTALVGDERLPTLSAGLTLEVPLGNKAARTQVSASQVSLRQIELQRESLARQVEAQLRAALAQVEAAEQGLNIAQKQVELAVLSEAGEAARVDAGTRRLDELLDARDALLGAQVDQLQAQLDLARAHLALAELSGRVDEVL
jgi:outer membrane protein